MAPITLKQAATFLVHFFGFFLLFYLTELPSYWLRSSFSPLHPVARNSYELSYDMALMMFCTRQVGYLLLGVFFFRQPHRLAALLLKYFGGEPPQLPI